MTLLKSSYTYELLFLLWKIEPLTDHVFSVLWHSQLIDELLYRIWRRSYEAKTTEVSHLLPGDIIESTRNLN